MYYSIIDHSVTCLSTVATYGVIQLWYVYKRGGIFIQVKVHGCNHFETCPSSRGGLNRGGLIRQVSKLLLIFIEIK